MREIVLDTETTGLDPANGDRIVEIGCLELVNHLPSGRQFHKYINPQRDMPVEAERIHGLSEEFLKLHGLFADIVDEFQEFIADSPLIIHNATFDMRFINAEFALLSREALPMSRTVDTLQIARRKFPGAQASLDALCRRFGIDNSNRDFHGALLDSELLAEVYLELIGGRQPGLHLSGLEQKREKSAESGQSQSVRTRRLHQATPEEEAAHREFVATLKDPVWNS